MTVTPLHYAPARLEQTDRAHNVIDLLPTYIDLAAKIANTEFVPTALRRRPEAVLAALLSGAERGLGPMESLRSVHIIEGRPTLSAEAMRALVLAAGHDIEIVEATAVKATVVGRRAGSDSTSVPFTWTIDRARRARLVGKDVWQRYPEAMLLARASTDLCRAIFPDVIAGLASSEEIIDEFTPDPATTSRRAPRQRGITTAPAPAITAAPPATSVIEADIAAADPASAAAVEDNERAAGPPLEEESSRIDGSNPSPPPAPAPDVDEIPGSDRPSWGTPTRSSPDPEPAPRPHDPKLAKRLHGAIAKTFPQETPAVRDRWRHALVAIVSRKRADGPTTSSTDLNLEEQMALSDALTRIAAGHATVAEGPDNRVELAGGLWRYFVSLDPLEVTSQQIEPTANSEDDTP
jgi:hypothetical protein